VREYSDAASSSESELRVNLLLFKLISMTAIGMSHR